MATVSSLLVPIFPESGIKVPPLEQGDRLTRAQFRERYAAMPANVKAERIEGTVHMAAAVSAEFHGDAHSNAQTWLGMYAFATPGVVASDNSTIALGIQHMNLSPTLTR